MAGPLTDAQVESYHRDGYVVLEGVFPEDELVALRAEADRIAELVVNFTDALERRNPRLDMQLRDDGRIALRKVQPVNDLSPLIASVSSDPRLIEPMRQLLGDEPVLMEEKLNYKQVLETSHLPLGFLAKRNMGESFPLHHDWGYYRQQGYPEDTISSAVTFDPCAGRGPIRIIPGSHRVEAPLVNPDPASGDGVVEPGFFDLADLVPMEPEAGSVMLFHSKLVHDSESNRSGLPRRLMIYSHHPRSHAPDDDPDRRNGPIRDYAQPLEAQYREMVATGAHVDRFALAVPGAVTVAGGPAA